MRVYIHIPFCASKCPYCDFYSFRGTVDEQSRYTNALLDEIKTLRRTGEYINAEPIAQSLYIGGGTPSVMSGENLYNIITTARERFKIADGSEITVECNPASNIEGILPHLKSAGVNRISLGLQSAVDRERRLLGRLSDRSRVENVISEIQKNGISNISLDVMLGISEQTKDSLAQTLDFAINSGATHISAYILKLEENTHLFTHRDSYNFPDDDTIAELYLQTCETLEKSGFLQYEISNFAKSGYESRHNTSYWLLEDYLGIGAAAHSFVGGKRFYFPRSAEAFIDGGKPIFDGYGGDSKEYIMLRLRLKSGLNIAELKALYGGDSADAIIKKAPLLKERGLVNYDGEAVSLTREGMLISNIIIAEFI